MEQFVAVYVDRSAHADAVRAAVSSLPVPQGVRKVVVDCSASTETFDCRIVVDLFGDFDQRESVMVARRYAQELRGLPGVPAHCLADLLRKDDTPS